MTSRCHAVTISQRVCSTKEDEDEDVLGCLRTTQDEGGWEGRLGEWGRSRLRRTLGERGEKADRLKAAWRTRAENPTSARLELGEAVAGSKKRRPRKVGWTRTRTGATEDQSKYQFWDGHMYYSKVTFQFSTGFPEITHTECTHSPFLPSYIFRIFTYLFIYIYLFIHLFPLSISPHLRRRTSLPLLLSLGLAPKMRPWITHGSPPSRSIFEGQRRCEHTVVPVVPVGPHVQVPDKRNAHTELICLF